MNAVDFKIDYQMRGGKWYKVEKVGFFEGVFVRKEKLYCWINTKLNGRLYDAC